LDRGINIGLLVSTLSYRFTSRAKTGCLTRYKVEHGLAKMIAWTKANPDLIGRCIASHQYFLDHPRGIRQAG
jgi:hypothetical protein